MAVTEIVDFGGESCDNGPCVTAAGKGNDPQSEYFQGHPQDVSDRELRLPRGWLHELDGLGILGEPYHQPQNMYQTIIRIMLSFPRLCVISRGFKLFQLSAALALMD